MPSPQMVNNVTNNTTNNIINNSGITNLGTIAGDVNNLINQLPTEKQDLKELLTQLQKLLQENNELKEAQKVTALEKVKTLAEATHKPTSEKSTVLNTVSAYLEGIAGFISAGEQIKSLLQRITALF